MLKYHIECHNTGHSFVVKGHMLWDTAMPANLGYIQALLYNQNNVALEASPVTTDMEITVCKQLCDMIFGI